VAGLVDLLDRLLSALLSEEEAEASRRAAELRERQYRLREEAVRCAYLVSLGAVVKGGVVGLAMRGRVKFEGGEVCFCTPDFRAEGMLKEGAEIDPADYERLRRVVAALSKGFKEPGDAVGAFRAARRLVATGIAAALALLITLMATSLGGVPSLSLLGLQVSRSHLVLAMALLLLSAVALVRVTPYLVNARLGAVEREVSEALREVEVVCRPYEEVLTGSGRPRRPS